jgi:hypothetical protein
VWNIGATALPVGGAAAADDTTPLAMLPCRGVGTNFNTADLGIAATDPSYAASTVYGSIVGLRSAGADWPQWAAVNGGSPLETMEAYSAIDWTGSGVPANPIGLPPPTRQVLRALNTPKGNICWAARPDPLGTPQCVLAARNWNYRLEAIVVPTTTNFVVAAGVYWGYGVGSGADDPVPLPLSPTLGASALQFDPLIAASYINYDPKTSSPQATVGSVAGLSTGYWGGNPLDAQYPLLPGGPSINLFPLAPPVQSVAPMCANGYALTFKGQYPPRAFPVGFCANPGDAWSWYDWGAAGVATDWACVVTCPVSTAVVFTQTNGGVATYDCAETVNFGAGLMQNPGLSSTSTVNLGSRLPVIVQGESCTPLCRFYQRGVNQMFPLVWVGTPADKCAPLGASRLGQEIVPDCTKATLTPDWINWRQNGDGISEGEWWSQTVGMTAAAVKGGANCPDAQACGEQVVPTWAALGVRNDVSAFTTRVIVVFGDECGMNEECCMRQFSAFECANRNTLAGLDPKLTLCWCGGKQMAKCPGVDAWKHCPGKGSNKKLLLLLLLLLLLIPLALLSSSCSLLFLMCFFRRKKADPAVNFATFDAGAPVCEAPLQVYHEVPVHATTLHHTHTQVPLGMGVPSIGAYPIA